MLFRSVCFLCEYSKLVKNCIGNGNQGGGCETPINFIQNLQNISEFLRVGRQEDAHEFLIYLLNAMEKSSMEFNELNELKSNRFVKEHRLSNLNNNNLIQKVYGGIYKSSVICLQCLRPSNTFEKFLDAGLVRI